MSLVTVPKSIAAPDEEASKLAHGLYQQILEALSKIEENFEFVSRVLYRFVEEPRLVDAMGWERPEDIFKEPEIRQHLDKMRIGSQAQYYRWKRLAKLDKKAPNLHILKADNLSMVTQTDQIKRLEELVDKDMPKDEMLDEMVTILGSRKETQEVAEDLYTFDFKAMTGYWRGKPAIRVVGKGLSAIRLISMLAHHPVKFKHYAENSSIVGYVNDDGAKEAVIISQDAEFLDYVAHRLKMRLEIQGD